MHLRNRRPLESKQLIKQDRSMTQHKALEHKERVCVTRSELAVPYTGANEPMARVSKMALGMISLARGTYCCPNFPFFCPTIVSILWRIWVTYRCNWLRRDCIWITVATKQYREWNIFRQIGSGAKGWLMFYHCKAGLAVTGRIGDIGQKVLHTSF
jgi:hypothetical protein